MPFLVLSQNNFASNSNKLSWQNVYETSLSSADFFNSVKTKKNFIDCNYDGDILYGTTPFIDIIKDHSGMVIFARYDIQLTYKIEFKVDKYRVTITDLVWDSTDFNDTTNFEELLLKKRDGTIRGANKYQKYLKALDLELTKIFTYKTPDGW